MEQLHAWLTAQLDEHRVEPNSGFGHAITYVRKHWAPLTLFLRQPGAARQQHRRAEFEAAILHRNNAYFYRTSNGAHVGISL